MFIFFIKPFWTHNCQQLLFKGISSKKNEADFEGGEVSSDAGVLFLREVENRIGLVSKITDSLRDRRHPGYVKHQLCELFKQRIFQIACGYEDGNDSNELREDPVMKIACERLPDDEMALASQPTISRFENSLTRTDLYRIAEVFVDMFIQSYDEPPEGIILDVDDTEVHHGNGYLGLKKEGHRIKFLIVTKKVFKRRNNDVPVTIVSCFRSLWVSSIEVLAKRQCFLLGGGSVKEALRGLQILGCEEKRLSMEGDSPLTHRKEARICSSEDEAVLL